MTFSEALEQISKGRVVARRSWHMFEMNFGIAQFENGGEKQLRLCGRGNWLDSYYPSHNDIFAHDWEVVEAFPPEGTEIRAPDK